MKPKYDTVPRSHPVLLAEQLHAPKWPLFLLILPAWTVWVFGFGPSPTPWWLTASAFLPLVALIGVPGVLIMRGVSSAARAKREALLELGFLQSDSMSSPSVERALGSLSRWIPTLNKAPVSVARIWSGQIRGARASFTEFCVSPFGRSVTWFAVSIDVRESPDVVMLTPREGFAGVLADDIERGLDRFKERWVIDPDNDASSLVSNSRVRTAIDAVPFSPDRHWVWDGSELMFLAKGTPTAAGVRTAISLLGEVAHFAGIIPEVSRGRGP